MMLGLFVSTLLVGPPVAVWYGPPEQADAQTLLDEAVQLYNDEQFAEAARAFRKAFALEPSPKYLYAWAQAERESGDCAAAIDLYQQFIEQGASESATAVAEENIARCEEQLEREAREQAAEEERRRMEEQNAAKDATPVRPWYADPLGGSLAGVGVAGLIAGGVLLGLAGAEANSEPGNVQAFRASLDRERNLWISGAVVTSAGGLLLAGAAVRYVVVNEAGKERARVALLPVLSGGLRVEVAF